MNSTPRPTQPVHHVLTALTDGARHRLVCRVCGRAEDTGCVVVTSPCLEPIDSAGYVVDQAQVVFWGRCPDCRSAER